MQNGYLLFNLCGQPTKYLRGSGIAALVAALATSEPFPIYTISATGAGLIGS